MVKTVTHTGPHGTVTVSVEPAHTSDGEKRDNAEPLAAVTLLTLPMYVDDGGRVAALYTLAHNCNLILTNKALANINAIDINASYDQNSVTQRLNDIINGINSVTPATLKTYGSTDYNAFNSIVSQISAALTTINT